MTAAASSGLRASSSQSALRSAFQRLFFWEEIYAQATPCCARYGLKQGFKNVVLKKVHDVATKFMDETPVCVHENVPGYEQVGKSSGIHLLGLEHDCVTGLFGNAPTQTQDPKRAAWR